MVNGSFYLQTRLGDFDKRLTNVLNLKFAISIHCVSILVTRNQFPECRMCKKYFLILELDPEEDGVVGEVLHVDPGLAWIQKIRCKKNPRAGPALNLASTHRVCCWFYKITFCFNIHGPVNEGKMLLLDLDLWTDQEALISLFGFIFADGFGLQCSVCQL